MEELKLRLLWGIGQVAARLAAFLMRLGQALMRAAWHLHEWADRR